MGGIIDTPFEAFSYNLKIMNKTKALIAGILAGLSSTATYSQTVNYQRPLGNDLSRMRNDLFKVGGYFQSVFAHENGSQAASK